MLCKDHHYKKKKSIVFLKKCSIGTIRFLFFCCFFFFLRERENLKSGVYFSFSVSPKNQQELRFFFSLLCLCLLIKHTCGLDSLRRCKEVWKKKRKKKRCNPVHWPVSLPLGLFRTAVRKRKRREEREKRRQFNKPNPDVHFIHTPWTAFAWFISFSETIFHQPVFSAGKLLV